MSPPLVSVEKIDEQIQPLMASHLAQVGRAYELSNRYHLSLAFDAGYKYALQEHGLGEYKVPGKALVVDEIATKQPGQPA